MSKKTKKNIANNKKSSVAVSTTTTSSPRIAAATNDKLDFLNKYSWHIIIVVSIVSFVIRIYNLDYQSLWVDEYVHADAARNFLYGKGHFWGDYELNQLFVNVLSSLFTAIFGYSDYMLRFPIALFSIAGIPAIYVLGRKLFNNSVGLMSAVLFAFSQYLIFWSRIDRAYGLVPGLYLWTLYFFWIALEEYSSDLKQSKFFHYIKINGKYFLFFVIAFLISFLTQIQVFLFAFTAGFYCTFIWIKNIASRSYHNTFLDKYAIIAYINIMVSVILFTPYFTDILHRFVGTFLPPTMADLIAPNWDRIKALMQTDNWNKNFLTYVDVTTSDLTYFYFFGWAGFVIAFYVEVRAAVFLITSFIVPMLIMGFILREPNLGKYMSFYYPMILISGSVSLWTIYQIIKNVIHKQYSSTLIPAYKNISIVVCILLLKSFIPIDKIKHFITTEDTIGIIDHKLSEVSFPPWKEYVNYVLERKQEGDIILGTLTLPLVHYLAMNKDTTTKIFQFRQNKLDGKNVKWVPMIIDEAQHQYDHANSYEGLVRLFNKYPRGWFLADYYLTNALSEVRSVEFCYTNMTYHFDASKDGAMKVFSWDKNNPKQFRHTKLIELGKKYNEQTSFPLEINISKNFLISPAQPYLTIWHQGIDRSEDLVVIINEQQAYNFPILSNQWNAGGRMQPNASNVKRAQLLIPKSVLREGANTIRFQNGEENDGFVIYEVMLDTQ